jgi:CDP-glycerol glycerophosphotransferase (TagB/SpsB family)
MPDPAARHEPTLSVIVPVYNVASYLPECLDSLLGQSLADLEVIAVDDGSTDGCLEILRRYAAADPRLRVLTQENSGQGAARNLGVAEARGRFLTFCDSDDTVPRRAFAAMVRTLRRTGSDFAVGAAIRVKHDRARQVAWGRTVHEFDRIATTIDEFPVALQDIVACNRMFRTDFWRARIGVFEEGIAYEDHVPMLAAYVRADRFDVLSRVTYQWRMREDQTSTGQQKAALQNLLDRIAVKEEAYDLLRAEASEATYDAWVGRCIDIDFPPFLPHAMTGSDEYRDALATTYRTFLDRATERALGTVRHHRAVRAWLCAERQWEALAVADEHFRESRQPAVRLQGDRLFAVPDLPPAVTDLVPAELWALADSETALRTGLRSVSVDGATIRVSGQALVPGLGTLDRPADLAAWLVDAAGGRTVTLPVTMRADPEVDQWADDGHVSYLHSAFDLVVDPATLTGSDPATTWTLRLRLQQGPVVRESGIYDGVEGSAGQRLQPSVVEAPGGPVQVEPGWDPASGLRLRVGPVGEPDAADDPGPAIRIHRVDLEPGSILVEARVAGLSDDDLSAATWRGQVADLPVTSVDSTPESVRLRFATTTTPPNGYPSLVPSGRYTLAVPTPDGEINATTAPPLAPTLPRSSRDAELRMTLRQRPNGTLVAVIGAPLDDDERRPDVQQRLRTAHRRRSSPPDPHPAVLFHAGGTVADSPAALDATLARTRPEVARFWAVRDHSVAVPDGAVPVLVGSRQWYDVLSQVPLQWASGELPDFFVRAPQQGTLQTFAGFPTTPIGLSAWRGRGMDARRVALELARRQQQWDHLVAPSEEIAAIYRRAFEFDGPVLVTGYPRCDGLVSRDRAEVRAALLARLGVPADRTVVLYAPAHRDRATRALLKSAAPPDLDVRRLAAALGAGHALLTLGVRVTGPAEPGAAPVIDVTTGPAVNDVLLAADAAVLDYSDLRFDWALTGRPAIFHVPDRDAHLGALPSPVDFDSTAAGPQVDGLDGVLDGLRDLAGTQARYATAVDAVNRRYNQLHDGRAGERVVQALLG